MGPLHLPLLSLCLLVGVGQVVELRHHGRTHHSHEDDYDYGNYWATHRSWTSYDQGEYRNEDGRYSRYVRADDREKAVNEDILERYLLGKMGNRRKQGLKKDSNQIIRTAFCGAQCWDESNQEYVYKCMTDCFNEQNLALCAASVRGSGRRAAILEQDYDSVTGDEEVSDAGDAGNRLEPSEPRRSYSSRVLDREERRSSGLKPNNHWDKTRCDEPMDQGTCKPANQRRWYYSKEKNDCDTFWFSGCQGNTNNFRSREICLAICVIKKS